MPLPKTAMTIEISHRLPLAAIAEGLRMWIEKNHEALGLQQHDLATISLRFHGCGDDHTLEAVASRPQSVKVS